MSHGRVTRAGSLGWATAALAALVTLVALPGAGRALAAPAPGGPAAPWAAYPRAAHPLAAGIISTVAGGVGGPGPARGISLFSANAQPIACGSPPGPSGLAFSAGRLYVADASVRQVSARTDRLTTPAGTGAAGPFGAGGPATRASIVACGVAVDHAGNLIIADPFRGRVEVLPRATGTFYGRAMTRGHLYVVAGNGGSGLGGTGVPAARTALTRPIDVTVDGAGNLVIADAGRVSPAVSGGRIRVVAASTGTFYGEAMTAGDIYTVAGTTTGTLFSGDGGPAVNAGLGVFISGIIVDPAGNLVLADSNTERVRVVAAATGTFYRQHMTAGDIYTVAGNGSEGFGGDGGRALRASFDTPGAVALDAAGNLLIADTINNRVRAVAASTGAFYGQQMTAGDVYTIAGSGGRAIGDGGPATQAYISYPEGLIVQPDGLVVVTDPGHNRVRVVPARTGTFYTQHMIAGDIYSVAGLGGADFCCDGSPATTAEMNGPTSVIADASGNLVIADQSDNRVRVVAAATGTFFGQQMTAGDIYTVAGNGKRGFPVINGTPATQAALRNPEGAEVDQAGNLLIADTRSNEILMVPVTSGTFYGVPMTAGDIYAVAGDGSSRFSGDGGPAVAAGISSPAWVTTDSAGNLLIADSANNRIRVVAARTGTFYGRAMTADDIYTVAGGGAGALGDGGPATQATLGSPWAVVPDHAGNLVIGDPGYGRVRVVAVSTGTFYGQPMTAGDIYTVAGDGSIGFSGDGGPATSAELNRPWGVAVDGAGNIAVADTNYGSTQFDMGNNRVRVVAAATGTFYGVPRTAGDIYTVAGNGTPGFSGDGHAATAAEIDEPFGVGVGAGGNLLIADVFDGRVRQVSG